LHLQAKNARDAEATQQKVAFETAERDKAELRATRQLTRVQQQIGEFIEPVPYMHPLLRSIL
jgi:hypothetical protein